VDPVIHLCETCTLPILLYGRVVSRLFCYTEAMLLYMGVVYNIFAYNLVDSVQAHLLLRLCQEGGQDVSSVS
jgi:hypothetical protein